MRWLLLFIMTLCGTGHALAASSWQTWGFDGSAFVKEGSSGAILVRDGYLPVPGAFAAKREDALPQGTGAVAVFCYQQRAGGKLKKQAGSAPMAGVVITIKTPSQVLAARSDESGYLVVALPPGRYELQLAGFTKTVTVEEGKTSLVAFRGSKRMVD